MDKKKKKKIIILSIISTVLIAALVVVGIILGAKNKNKNTSKQPSTNVNYSSNTINEAIALGKVSKNYDGRYEFSGVRSVSFNSDLTEEQILTICKNAGGKNKNDLIYYLYQDKINSLNGTKEILTFKSSETYGRFTKQNTELAVGSYVGDENLSLITILGTNEQIFISLNYNEVQNAYTVNNTTISSVGTKLYLFKKVYSANNSNQFLFEITYEYTKLVNTIPAIPDADLDFNL